MAFLVPCAPRHGRVRAANRPPPPRSGGRRAPFATRCRLETHQAPAPWSRLSPELRQQRDALARQVEELVGVDRGIFAMDGDDRRAAEKALAQLEALNPNREPLLYLNELVADRWRLLYTNLTIVGRRRALLNLSPSSRFGFAMLGELYQVVHPLPTDSSVNSGRSENIVELVVLGTHHGTYRVDADYSPDPADRARVLVQRTGTTLRPESLVELLGNERRQLIDQIFDPTGYLDITYVDELYRIGRDSCGHLFFMKRVVEAGSSQ